jgi:hypothetical protein
MNQKPEAYSPMRLQVCSQMWFDPILQRFARTFRTSACAIAPG